MKRILELYPFFLFLIPAFVTIHLEKEMQQVISYRFVYDRIIVFFIVPLIFLSLAFLFMKSVKKASLIAFTLSIFFFYTGEIKNWLFHKFPSSIWQSYTFLLPLILLISVLIIYRIHKRKTGFRNHFLILNIGLLLFIAADIISIGLNYNKSKYQLETDTEIKSIPCTQCEKPDIYYILLDTYTSTPVLQSDFNYVNKYIEDDLKSKGFIITPDSKSNYTYTAFSIASTFNVDYITNVDTINKIFDMEYVQMLKLVYNNRLLTFLENEDYSILNHSLFNFKSYPSTINNFDNWDFRKHFDQYNFFLKLNHDIGYHLPLWAKRLMGKNKNLINNPVNRQKFDSLVQKHLFESTRISTSKPKFIYAHFLMPHTPYLTDSLGKYFSKSTLNNEDAYIHQIAFANRIIKNVTDSILAYTKRPLAIIIQGDHGYWYNNRPDNEKEFAVFNAVYFSNKQYRQYSDTVSNVNTFRIVLNTFFNKDYPLLENRTYHLH